jgi:hypothetical protein
MKPLRLAKRRLAPVLGLVAGIIGFSAAAQDFSGIGGQYIDFGASMMAVGQMNNVLGNRPCGAAGAARIVASPERAPGYRRRGSPCRSIPAIAPRPPSRPESRASSPTSWPRPTRPTALACARSVQQQDLLGVWEKHVSVDGLRRGDVADAMTAYWVQNWQIANNVRLHGKRAGAGGPGQVYRALGSNPAVRPSRRRRQAGDGRGVHVQFRRPGLGVLGRHGQGRQELGQRAVGRSGRALPQRDGREPAA